MNRSETLHGAQSQPAMELCVVLLAAGAGRRFGGAKQLTPIQGVPMVRWVARELVALSLPVFAVLGAHADDVGAALSGLALRQSVNPDWAAGIGASIAFATRWVSESLPSTTHLMLCLGDLPMLGRAHYEALLAASAAAPGKVIICESEGIRSPPAIFPRSWFEALMGLEADRGAGALLRSVPDQVVAVPMAEALFDIDRPEDLRRLPG